METKELVDLGACGCAESLHMMMSLLGIIFVSLFLCGGINR